MITSGFKKFLKRKIFLKQRDNKKLEGKKNKEVTCYECKKLRHIRSECSRLKFKGKRAKDKKNAFKASWYFNSKKEDEQQKVVNLYFMALEDNNMVP